MDPITTAIVTALVAGALSGLAETGKTGMTDAYQALKDLLAKKFGVRHQVMLAVHHLETHPFSTTYQQELTEEIGAIQAEQDQDVLAAAKHLWTLVQSQQAGSGKYTIQNTAPVQGQTVGDHNTITQQFGERSNT